MVKLFIAFLALLAGIASSTQGLYNGYWKDELDLKTILLVNSLVVFGFVAIFYLLSSGDGIKLSMDKITPSILVGGICGFFIILIFAISFPSIGALATSLLFIIAFLITSIFYDNIGALNLVQRPITIEKIIGVGLVIVGTFLALRGSFE
ncbi:MAG: DMT family transporter [Campylobacterota bacterium]|nr:DMT family transporter [Campylobacterota bacterium]